MCVGTAIWRGSKPHGETMSVWEAMPIVPEPPPIGERDRLPHTWHDCHHLANRAIRSTHNSAWHTGTSQGCLGLYTGALAAATLVVGIVLAGMAGDAAATALWGPARFHAW